MKRVKNTFSSFFLPPHRFNMLLPLHYFDRYILFSLSFYQYVFFRYSKIVDVYLYFHQWEIVRNYCWCIVTVAVFVTYNLFKYAYKRLQYGISWWVHHHQHHHHYHYHYYFDYNYTFTTKKAILYIVCIVNR